MTTKTEEKNTIERITLQTPERSFGTIAEASDFFSSRVIKPMVYEGKQLSVTIEDQQAYLNIAGKSQSGTFPIRDSGMEGLFQRAGLGLGNFPMKVADDHLIEYNLNYLFKHLSEKDLMVIFDKNEGEETYGIKSVMSDSYNFVNHSKVLDIVKNLNLVHEVHALQLTKDWFRMSVTNPKNKVEAVVGDISSVGVDLMNSENGHASLWLGQFLYRYWCSNGASHIDESSSTRSRAIHRGNTIQKALNEFSDTAKWHLTNGAKEIEANFKVLAETEVTNKTLGKVLPKAEKAVGKKNTENLMEEWKKTTGKKQCDSQEWTSHGYVKVENTCFNLAQLLTLSAHRGIYGEDGLSKVSGSQRLGLEKVGGWMYNNPKAL